MSPTTQTLVKTLSVPRISTYLAARSGSLDKALELYGWNARISAALMLPAHFAEVSTRNSVDEALTDVYGPTWPWNSAFELSLPNPPAAANTYNPRRDLRATRAKHTTTGKVIADLKFVFWQKMFTRRHDERVWNTRILKLFPGAPEKEERELRLRVADDLEAIRQLRNRIAHHEPVFSRALATDLAKMLDLVQIRRPEAETWVRSLETASAILLEYPN